MRFFGAPPSGGPETDPFYTSDGIPRLDVIEGDLPTKAGQVDLDAVVDDLTAHENNLAIHSSGRELAYAESTSAFSSASLAAGAAEDVAPAAVAVAVNFTAGARPIVLEGGAYAWQAGTVGARPELQITDTGNVVQARQRYFATMTGSNIIWIGPRVFRRLQLTQGNSYSFKLRVSNASGATAASAISVYGLADAPIWLQAREV